MKRLARGFWLLLFLTSICFGGEQVTDKKFGFSFTVPEPFQSYELDKKASPDLLYGYVDREATPEDPATVLHVERMRGVIDPRERMKAEQLPKLEGISTTLETFSWGGLELDLLRQEVTRPDAPVTVGFTLQVPLGPEAVQIIAGGPLNREADVRKALEVFTADFKNLRPLYIGKPEPAAKAPVSKEYTPSERGTKMAGGIFKLTITALVVLVIIRAIMAAVRRKKKSG